RKVQKVAFPLPDVLKEGDTELAFVSKTKASEREPQTPFRSRGSHMYLTHVRTDKSRKVTHMQDLWGEEVQPQQKKRPSSTTKQSHISLTAKDCIFFGHSWTPAGMNG